MYLQSSAVTYFLDLYLQSKKLKVEDYTIRHFEPEPLVNAFISGEVEFMVNFDPYNRDALIKGNGRVLANSSKFIGVMPEGIFATKETLDKIPLGDLTKIMKAWVEASDWLQDQANWPRYQEILNKSTFPDQEKFGAGKLKVMRQTVRIHNSKILKVRNQDQGGAYKYMSNLRSFLQRTKNATLPRDLTTVIDNRAIMAALQ